MALAPFLRALGAACVLLLSAPVWGAADETTPSSPAAALDEARALVDAGRFNTALTLLRSQVRGETVEANALFLYGLAAAGASQGPGVPDDEREALLDEAIAAFRIMLIDRPGLVRVRLELARAFFLKGEDGLARRHFEHVLAGEPVAEVAANVRHFLNEIRARKRWSFSMGFALAPDSNIGGTSDERTIYIFNLPFQRDAEELTASGVGVSVWGAAEYQVPVSDSLRLRAGAEAARREYERSQFDQLFLAGHLGPRWLLDRDTELSVMASTRQSWLGTAPDHRDLGARFEAGHRVSSRVTVSGQASWHKRRYRTRTHLDGPVLDASLRGDWVIMPTVRAELSVGYGRDRPRLERERNRSSWLSTGVSVILPLGFTVGGGGEVRWTDYKGNWFPFIPDGSAREDKTRSVRASVHNRAFTLLGFSPELVVVQEERESNAQLHGYNRTRGELRFVQQF